MHRMNRKCLRALFVPATTPRSQGTYDLLSERYFHFPGRQSLAYMNFGFADVILGFVCAVFRVQGRRSSSYSVCPSAFMFIGARTSH